MHRILSIDRRTFIIFLDVNNRHLPLKELDHLCVWVYGVSRFKLGPSLAKMHYCKVRDCACQDLQI